MKTNRAGEELADVGPNFRRLYSSKICTSVTGLSCHLLWVRASRNSRSCAAASSVMDVTPGEGWIDGAWCGAGVARARAPLVFGRPRRARVGRIGWGRGVFAPNERGWQGYAVLSGTRP